MNHQPTSRHRRAIVATSIAGLLLAAACGDRDPTVQTEVAPAAPGIAQRELDDLENDYQAGARELTPLADPFAFNVEERTAPQSAAAADHPSQDEQSDQPTRPASGPRPH
jgi:hypothetical protein